MRDAGADGLARSWTRQPKTARGTPKPGGSLVRTLLRLVLLIALAAFVGAAPAAAADPEGPQDELASPVEGAVFYQGEHVQAAWGCFPGTPGWTVITCQRALPLGDYVDTSGA